VAARVYRRVAEDGQESISEYDLVETPQVARGNQPGVFPARNELV
jgi:hypothetical protein